MTAAMKMHSASQARDLGTVRSTLAALQISPDAPAESRYLASYYRAALAEREGDYRSALAAVQEAVDVAERLGLDRYLWLAEEELALLLRGVGRSREAAELFERLRKTPRADDDCDRAPLLNNQAWSALLAREAGEELPDPTPLLEEAITTYARCSKPTTEARMNAEINLALAHLQEGRLVRAGELLARARKLAPHPPLPHTLWRLDLEARLELREGRARGALERFDELAARAAETSSFDAALRAALGQARARQALGDGAAALSTLAAVERLLDEQSLQVPVQAGRESFLAARRAVVDLHVELLLDQGRAGEAFAVARAARSRILRQLAQADRLAGLSPEQRSRRDRLLADYEEQRAALEQGAAEEWKLPADRLPSERAARRVQAEAARRLLDEALLVLGERAQQPPEPPPARPGELVLAYHPLANRWVGFAADGTTVVAHRTELPPPVLADPDELARRLLLPFRAAIERAQRIRILTSGALENVDFHALPFDGEPLLAARPVAYGLDLRVIAPPAGGSARRALLVTDPRGDLPGAAAEAGGVRRVLAAGAPVWRIDELAAADASAAAVRGRLAGADLLHYAGHGSFSGSGGWDSSLLLAHDSRLTVGDLLAVGRAPSWVVLSGCDTGRSAGAGPVAGLGLAQAFLLTGSRGVVASTRPTADRAVPALFVALYRQWAEEPDLAVALQRAQLQWREEGAGADWASFRLLQP